MQGCPCRPFRHLQGASHPRVALPEGLSPAWSPAVPAGPVLCPQMCSGSCCDRFCVGGLRWGRARVGSHSEGPPRSRWPGGQRAENGIAREGPACVVSEGWSRCRLMAAISGGPSPGGPASPSACAANLFSHSVQTEVTSEVGAPLPGGGTVHAHLLQAHGHHISPSGIVSSRPLMCLQGGRPMRPVSTKWRKMKPGH